MRAFCVQGLGIPISTSNHHQGASTLLFMSEIKVPETRNRRSADENLKGGYQIKKLVGNDLIIQH